MDGKRRVSYLSAAMGGLLVLAGCSSSGGDATATSTTGSGPTATAMPALSGSVNVDGSSTVFPITEAVAEEFQKVAPNVRVSVAVSGTGGGFKLFCEGSTDISNASRPIKDSEKATCDGKSISFVELPVAIDGLSVVVNKDNTFVDYLTVAELKRIWEPNSQVNRWNQVRPNWPDEEISLYGPGTDSGTFDYFTEVINGKVDASRSDYSASEDDNVLVQGISGDRFSLGYFGYAYYFENKDNIKVVPIDPGDGKAITPEPATITSGTYKPLSRYLFIYVSKQALKDKPQLLAFVDFYLKNAAELVKDVGYVELSASAYAETEAKFKAAQM